MKYIFLIITLALPLTVLGDEVSPDAATCDCSNENMDCSGREITTDTPSGGGSTGTPSGGGATNLDGQ